MATYRATTEIPQLVRQAMDIAEHVRFEHSCTPEVGRLLRLLTGHLRDGRIGEIGTGCGVSAAWIVSALVPGASFVTVELDAARAEAARALLDPYPNVRVLQGDWHGILDHGPFDLLFADTKAKRDEAEIVLGALSLGGMVVLDDMTPGEHWPHEWRGQPDPVREFWLNEPRLAATEVLTGSTMAAIVATRIG
jgi:predicted O-methyltransferase YrrM